MLQGYDSNDVRYYLAAVNLAEKYGSGDPRLHLALCSAADKCRFADSRLAEKLLKRDIAELEKLDVNFPEIVYDCYELARIFEWQGRYAEAESVLLRALSIRKKWQDISSDNPFNAELLACLYLIYYSRGETNKANETEVRALNAVQQMRNELTRGHCLSSLEYLVRSYACVCKRLSPAQAKHLIETALGFSDRAVYYFRKHDALYDLAGQLNGSTRDALELGDDKKAERMTRESLKLAFADFDNMQEIPWIATSMLCQIVCKDGRYHEADQLHRNYLSALARLYGSSSPKYADRLNQIAIFWEGQHQSGLAAKYRKEEKLVTERLGKK
jgi:tetratricopeptide (TPR) repeat protein